MNLARTIGGANTPDHKPGSPLAPVVEPDFIRVSKGEAAFTGGLIIAIIFLTIGGHRVALLVGVFSKVIIIFINDHTEIMKNGPNDAVGAAVLPWVTVKIALVTGDDHSIGWLALDQAEDPPGTLDASGTVFWCELRAPWPGATLEFKCL